MPAADYDYSGTTAARVILIVRPHRQSDTIHEVPGPYMGLEKAEEHIAVIREKIGTGETVDLPWLAIDSNSLIGVYLT